jgi:hypothetical protein
VDLRTETLLPEPVGVEEQEQIIILQELVLLVK